MFEKLDSRLLVHATLTAETGLHIGRGGSSLDPSATDSAVMRDAAGQPFIPGSSFKGALRAHVESLLRALKPDDVTFCCDPLAAPCITKDGIAQIKEQAKERATTAKKDEAQAQKEPSKALERAIYDREMTAGILRQTCQMCRLCGSPYLASRLLVKDLFVDPASWFGKFELRDGVGIDRDTETARANIKYDFEVVPASTRFRLEMALENGDQQATWFFLVSLQELQRGRVSLGGKTTRGLGQVQVQLQSVEVIEGREDLVSLLVSGAGRRLEGEAMMAYLQTRMQGFAEFLKGV